MEMTDPYGVYKSRYKIESSKINHVPGITGIAKLAGQVFIELDKYHKCAEGTEDMESVHFQKTARMIERIQEIIAAAKERNFRKTTALSLISRSITESLDQEKPRNFAAAIMTLKFFAVRLQMAIEECLDLDDIKSLKNMCAKIQYNVKPYTTNSSKM